MKIGPRVVALTSGLVITLAGLGAVPSQAVTQNSPPTDQNDPKPKGRWVSYDQIPDLQSQLGPQAEKPSSTENITPQTGGCHPGTTNYPSTPRFNCISVTKDRSGEKVVLRQGTTKNFGYLKALRKHNVDQQTIEHVVRSNTAGYKESKNRYKYGMGFISKHGIEVLVEVYQQRTPGAGSPDPYELGVVTAFCRDNPYAESGSCPDWVNDDL